MEVAPPGKRTKAYSGLSFVLFIAAAATELEPLVGGGGDAHQADVVDAGGEEKILEETLEKPKKR